MAWYNTSWQSRVKVTTANANVDADLTGFPIYLNLANLPADFHAKCNQTDARDIRITLADGVTEVPVEIVYYNAAADAGEVHFKGDILNASDVDFYVYYNNISAGTVAANATYGSQNVWDANYLFVHHYGDGTTLSLADSTANANNATNINAATATSGQIGGAILFAKASSQYLTIADKAQFKSLTALTIEVFGNLTSVDTDGYFFLTKNVNDSTPTDPYEDFAFFGDATRNTISRLASSPTTGWTDLTQAAAYMPLSTWTQMVFSYDHVTMRNYKNGAVSATTVAVVRTTGVNTNPLRVGSFIQAGFNYDFDGKMDEMRMSNIARADTWLSTQYKNHNSAATFYAVGSAETISLPVQLNNFQNIKVGSGMSSSIK